MRAIPLIALASLHFIAAVSGLKTYPIQSSLMGIGSLMIGGGCLFSWMGYPVSWIVLGLGALLICASALSIGYRKNDWHWHHHVLRAGCFVGAFVVMFV